MAGVTGDLFGAFADELDAIPLAPKPAEAMPLALCGNAAPEICASGVASFACECGARDEVLEPAPATVDCWGCKLALGMRRWHPPVPPPNGNARITTDAERARLP